MPSISDIVDCPCGLRYMRTDTPSSDAHTGAFHCRCGESLGAWNGLLNVVFEAEEEAPLRLH